MKHVIITFKLRPAYPFVFPVTYINLIIIIFFFFRNTLQKIMSTVQTKLNFLEKKKTSARLQETFKLKEKSKDISTISKLDHVLISNSPNKHNASKQINSKFTSSKLRGSNEELSGKENQNVIHEISKRNPVVVLFRSPSKCNNVIRSCNINYEQPQEKVRGDVDEVHNTSRPTVFNQFESPKKCTERRNVKNECYVLRSSPLKRTAFSPEKIKYSSGKFCYLGLV